jgi:hypothetical protein
MPLTVNCITTLLSPITALCVAGVTETDNAPGKNAYIYIYIVIGLKLLLTLISTHFGFNEISIFTQIL